MQDPTYSGISSNNANKSPPFSREAEQSVLGGIIINNEAWISIADLLIEKDFFLPEHQTLFSAIKSLSEENQPCDPVTLAGWLDKHNKLDSIGGGTYLGHLTGNTPSAANIKAYAEIVRERSILRHLVHVGTEIASSAYDPQGRPSAELLDNAEKLVFEIAELGARNQAGFIKIGDILPQTLDHIEKLSQQEGTVTGISTGFTDFDIETSGLQRSDLIIVAGRPSMGKCIVGDSKIVLENGSIATIEEIYHRKKARLFSLGENNQFYLTQPSDFIDDGLKPVFRVTTQLGRTIETTESHPFLSLEGWKPLYELEVGDKIAVPRKIHVFGNETLKDSEIKTLVDNIGKDNLIPSIVFTLPLIQISLFINLLLTNNKYYSNNEECLRQVQHLLLRFGILAAIKGQYLEILHVKIKTTEHIYWDDITAIELLGLKQVYDLTIPTSHNFVANDICVHNTSFAMNIAEHVAVNEKKTVAVFSMEMSNEQLLMRLISSLGRVNLQSVRTGKLEDDEWASMTEAVSKLQNAPLFIDETPALSPTELRAKVRRLAREEGQLGLIVIDYLQLMQVPSNKESRATEVSEISRSLKSLAKELNVPVLALSQLNRGLEQRTDKRPKMADLRESGSIEQDSDLIAFIYRDEVYNEDSPDQGTAEIIIAKQRNGPVGTTRLFFKGEITKFENFTSTDNFYGE
ncbi:MAG: replicative DNA helicase [Thiotrichaceae bacterium]|nr:replicative DNA helicase [Thiotrichaceae bacterium]